MAQNTSDSPREVFDEFQRINLRGLLGVRLPRNIVALIGRLLGRHVSGVVPVSTTITSLCISGDGSIVAFPDPPNVVVWDVARARVKKLLRAPCAMFWRVAMSEDGERIVASSSWMSQSYVLRVWITSTGKCDVTMHGHTGEIKQVAMSIDGRMVVSGSEDRTLRIWDSLTGLCESVLTDSSGILCVAIVPGNRHIASSNCRGDIKLWSVLTGAVVWEKNPGIGVWSLCVSHTGRTMAYMRDMGVSASWTWPISTLPQR